MIQAIIYGVTSGGALLVGATLGIRYNWTQKQIARFMAFGAGVLICALTFGLMEESFAHGGFDAVIIGFISGGLVFILGDYFLHLKGGRRHKRRQLMQPKAESSNGKVITMGALLDGIPESLALGITLFLGQGHGVLMLLAIVLSNFPEGISSVEGLIREGFSKKQIFLIWSIVGIIIALTVIASFIYLPELDRNNLGIIEAFAAGAILAMIADSMMPEAFEEGGFSIGLLTILGFLSAFIVAKL